MPEQTLVEKLEKAMRNPLSFNPIKIESYDRDTFIKAQKKLSDLGKYYEALKKSNAEDIDARNDLYGLLLGDPSVQEIRTPHEIVTDADISYGSAIERMGRYVEKNRGTLLNKLKGKSLNAFVMSLPLYQIDDKNEKEHNGLVSLINEVRIMAKIQQDEKGNADVEAMREFLAGGLEKQDLSKDYGLPLVGYWLRSEAMVAYLFKREFGFKQKILGTKLSKKEQGKELDEDKLRNLVKISLRSAYDELEDEDDEGNRKDIWEGNIRPHYLELAKAVHKIEKKEADDENKDKVEEKERESKRQSLGMSV